MIDWNKINVSTGEMDLIAQIAARAQKLMGRKRLDTIMDLEVVHSATPLRLRSLLEADDFNFGHDIAGIARHLNRETGELMDCFVPRFIRSEAA